MEAKGVHGIFRPAVEDAALAAEYEALEGVRELLPVRAVVVGDRRPETFAHMHINHVIADAEAEGGLPPIASEI